MIRRLGPILLAGSLGCAGGESLTADGSDTGASPLDAAADLWSDATTDFESSLSAPADANSDRAPTLVDTAGGPDAAPASSSWSWGNSTFTENQSLAFIGYDQGCSQYGELRQVQGGVAFQVGYRLTAPVADRLKHHAGYPSPAAADDGPLAGYTAVGTVLVLWATKEVRDPTSGDFYLTLLTAPQRMLSTEPTAPNEASFTGTLMVPGGNPCSVTDTNCRVKVEPTMIVVWQKVAPVVRAYQFIRPQAIPRNNLDRPRFADCPLRPGSTPDDSTFHQSVGVYWPLREDLARTASGAPDPTQWTKWIDEVLPR